MVINDFQNSYNLHDISESLENKPVWLNQVDSELSFSISMKGMASSDMIANHRFHRWGSSQLIDSLKYLQCHLWAMLSHSL